jgi:hypothetical protein
MTYIILSLVMGVVMQKYAELKFRELSDSFALKMFDEWDKAASSLGARGFVFPNGQLFRQIRENKRWGLIFKVDIIRH